MIQQRAEDHNSDLIAMAISTDQTNLKSPYKRYLQCAATYGLLKALRFLVFGEMIQDLAGEREKILINSGHPLSDVTVDICFCLDCTGSM
ncbi:unnamed protein product, partial [Rotaria magnacalcarata]